MSNIKEPEIYIIIPAYDPDAKLKIIVNELIANSFDHVVLVNDGSSKQHDALFNELAQHPQLTLLTHPKNKGKGEAIKTALRHITQSNLDHVIGAITLDADGQHLISDVVELSKVFLKKPDDLVLGVRQFDDDTPWRSRFGNVLTRYFFQRMYKEKLADTQTGLRAIPKRLFKIYNQLTSHRYEYEMDCLIKATEVGVHIEQMPIKTVYYNNNEASHFKPLLDSIRVYTVFFHYAIIALLSFVLDIAIFSALHWITGTIFFSLIIARACSSVFNFIQNKYKVYKVTCNKNLKQEAWKYAKLALGVFISAYISIHILLWLFHMHVIVAKIIVDLIIFVISYFVQKFLIFKPKKSTS